MGAAVDLVGKYIGGMRIVRDLPGSESDRSIVSAILLMASGLNLQVIAEGVETEQHRRALQLLGCRLFQGYLFGRPERASHWLGQAF